MGMDDIQVRKCRNINQAALLRKLRRNKKDKVNMLNEETAFEWKEVEGAQYIGKSINVYRSSPAYKLHGFGHVT